MEVTHNKLPQDMPEGRMLFHTCILQKFTYLIYLAMFFCYKLVDHLSYNYLPVQALGRNNDYIVTCIVTCIVLHV